MSVTILSKKEKLEKATNLWTNEFQKQKQMYVFFPAEGLVPVQWWPVVVIEIAELRPKLLFKVFTPDHITFNVSVSELRKLEDRYDR